jgi:acetyl/propionyl-CoA carboxylase alpha subunit
VIRKLLIANRGEIASRVIRTARALDITTVAVFSDPDSAAPYVSEADESVALPGAAADATYLRADLLIDAALRAGADAVHPGYGFLSENADFAQACADAGLVFIGPPPAAIRAMGSKTSAKLLMAQAGVPVLPGLTVGDGGEQPENLEELSRTNPGFPLLVKAAFGGGGRGMRIVRQPGELPGAVAAARREAAAAFGNGTVFLERLVERPRHVEVQIFADTHGQAIHLFERECSIQRRYQKIIEEAPSPAVDRELRTELGNAAVLAAKTIGYVGAGTVEFILDERGDFYFLEVNTRLQVEHPVTELVTGLDLVALQIAVAEGKPLPAEVLDAELSGHAIEARLYAEDVAAGYLPATGTLRRFEVPARVSAQDQALGTVRVDAGAGDGSVIGVHYDPMLAKVIAHAPTREQAARLLARALAAARLHGVVTNRDLLVGILREPEFLAGRIDTGYLTRHAPAALMAAAGDPRADEVHAIAVALADQAWRRATAEALPAIPSGWRNVRNAPQQVSYAAGERAVTVGYEFRPGRAGRPGGMMVDIWAHWDRPECPPSSVAGDAGRPARLFACTPDLVDLELDGVRRRVSVERDGPVRYADSALGASALTELPRFPEPETEVAAGSLTAPMNGTVVRVLATAGDAVAAGQALVVLEAMKMEHQVRAPADGRLTELRVSVGEAVDQGMVLAVVDSGADSGGDSGADGGTDSGAGSGNEEEAPDDARD